MYNKLLNIWVKFRHNDEGVTLVEYGIALTVAVVVGATALTLLAAATSTSIGLATAVMPK